jgi:hypothetical protein
VVESISTNARVSSKSSMFFYLVCFEEGEAKGRTAYKRAAATSR